MKIQITVVGVLLLLFVLGLTIVGAMWWHQWLSQNFVLTKKSPATGLLSLPFLLAPVLYVGLAVLFARFGIRVFHVSGFVAKKSDSNNPSLPPTGDRRGE